MENEHNSPFGNQPTKTETKADKEWTEFERDLDTLGHQLAALQAHTAALGSQLVSSLEARFQEVKGRAQSFKQARELELEQMRLKRSTAGRKHLQRCANAFGRGRAPSVGAIGAAAPGRQGCRRRIGARLDRIARLVRQGRRPAAYRDTTNGPAPAASDDRRETT